MKGWKIMLAAMAVLVISGNLMQRSNAWALACAAAIAAFCFGLICTLVEIYAKISGKPFALGLAVLWSGIALIGFSAAVSAPFGYYVGGALTLFGIALWRSQRRRESPAFQAAQQKQQEEAMLYQQEYDRLFTIDEVRLLDSYVLFKRGGAKEAGLGCLLAGPIGALLNSLILPTKQVRIQRFQILYTSGRSGTEEHPAGSDRYKELMRYVRTD